jgi:hypothetical protein
MRSPAPRITRASCTACALELAMLITPRSLARVPAEGSDPYGVT